MVDEAFLLEGFHVPQTRSMEHPYLRNNFPLRQVFHKPILPSCPPFTVISGPAAGSRRVFRGWTPPPLTGVGINLWTWKANGFLAPFRY